MSQTQRIHQIIQLLETSRQPVPIQRFLDELEVVSPQRLPHYRENWYLLAWCHRVDALRRFALDAVRHAEPCKEPARRVAARRLDAAMGSGFGIFGGPGERLARLRFSPVAVRWIADERWYPQQRFGWEGEHLVLEIPYAQSRELIMEILRHGSDVEVLGPAELRGAVQRVLRATLSHYERDATESCAAAD